MTRHRLVTTLAATVALAAPAVLLTAAPATAAPATAASVTTAPAALSADPGFREVATLPGGGFQSLVSPAEGEAYVSGSDTDRMPYLKHVTATGTTDIALPAPAAGQTVLLAHDGTRTYALVDRTLHEVRGTTLRPVPLPATVPGTQDRYYPEDIAAADGTLWLAATVTTTAPYEAAVALRFDGSTWTASPRGPVHAFAPLVARGAKGNTLYTSAWVSLKYYGSGYDRVSRWDGVAWDSVPGGTSSSPDGSSYDMAWTLATDRDYTVWGYKGQFTTLTPRVAATGTCMHVVGKTTSPCPAPEWPVSAAARLADGRTVIGGADGHDVGSPAAVPGAFALVDGDGATPTPLAGDNRTRVLDIAAPPAGTTVWAVTSEVHAPKGYVESTTYRLTTATIGADATPNPAPVPPAPRFDRYDDILTRGLTGVDIDDLPFGFGLAGLRPDGHVVVGRHGDHWMDNRNIDAVGSGVTVRGAGERLLVLVHGKDGAADALYTDVATEQDMRRVDLPTTVPGTSDPAPTSWSLATEGEDVYLTGRVPTTGRPVVLHRTGDRWSASVAPMPASAVGRRSWVEDGVVWALATVDGQESLLRVNGSTWEQVTPTQGTEGPNSFGLAEVTPVSPTSADGWGHGRSSVAWGVCASIDGAAKGSCPAPAWPVSAALRLDEGRTVLGGADRQDGVAATSGGGFALVPSRHARPVAMGGDNGERVVRIVGRPDRSGGAYALVQDASGFRVLHSDLRG